MLDIDGNDVEETFKQKKILKRIFFKNTICYFCENFLKHKIMRDPYTNEVGKTSLYVSQNHATKVTQILNQYADKLFPNQYTSDFAVQVTFLIENSQHF